ncbi:MAG: TlpA family protein disulfide reductase [Candidatus Bathyarchaeota archaeon]|nr:TlpA family protein disulfide reductase [Candidatus Bathyarchaeota archaeon]
MNVKKEKGIMKPKYYYIIIVIVLFIALMLFFFITSETGVEDQYAKDFTLKNIDGQSFNLSDYQGKVLVLDFMATWCKPCRIQMKELVEVWQEYEGEIVIISVAIDPTETDEELKAFFQEFEGATWILAKDAPELTQFHEVVVIPTLVIIDQNGNIVLKHPGVIDSSTLIEEIEKLI